MRGLSTFQRLVSSLGAAPIERVVASIAGVGVCRLRALSTSGAAWQGKAETIPEFPDALDQEFDRGDDVAMARVREAQEAERERVRREEGLKCPVDLETEFDRDDPDAVNPEELYAERRAEPLQEVDLDTEFDRDDPMLADKSHMWDAPEPPQPANIDAELDLMEDTPKAYPGMTEPKPTVPGESPGGTMAGNAPFGQGGRRAPQEPDARIGQYRESKAA